MNDISSGVTALYAILGAYISKLRHGAGQYVETSLLEAGLAWSHWESGAWFGGGEEPLATGTRHRRSTPYQAYKTKDGYVTVGANNNKLWTNFCNITCDKPEWLTDPRFKDLPSRSPTSSPPSSRRSRPRTGWKNSMPHRCRAARSTPLRKYLTIRTSRHARWWSNTIIRKSAA